MRFYCPDLKPHATLGLPPDEATHAARVMRVKAGDACELFDGRGRYAAAVITEAGQRDVAVTTGDVIDDPRTLPGRLEVAIGLPKGDRQRSVVERATELGVHRLVPLDCEFGVAEATPAAMARGLRTTIESCKQSGRNQLLEFAKPVDAVAYFASASPDEPVIRLLCHPRIPHAVPVSRSSIESLCGQACVHRVVLAIGPEGGFSDAEVAAGLATGWLPLDLGTRILRVETALAAAVTFAGLLLIGCSENG